MVSPCSAQVIQPIVAIHDSELTRALESMPATNGTPTGLGTTTNQWWTTNWHYFVMPESAKEALRSDGTPFTVVSDANITANSLLSNGLPKYPIVISLASEAMRDDEIAPLTNYVAAGGFLLVGSSAFTRNTNGTTRGDFAFANELGVHMTNPALTNWRGNLTITKQFDHRVVNHIPFGKLAWGLPSSSEEVCWGLSPSHPYLPPHLIWQVAASDATVVAQADVSPMLTVKQFGKGYFIYYSPMQPLIGHGGWAPGMYAYMLFRKAIEWAFESANLPVTRLSPWPYPYDSAFMVRHDLENITNEVAAIAASAQFEFTNGARGDYYFCTGTLREDTPAANTNAVVINLRQAVTNFGATIGPHNGGLSNANNGLLVRGDYDYWHWGLDEALSATPSNYPSGKIYALASLSNSFANTESWLSGITNGIRAWVAPYFNATREDSYDIQAQLGVKIAGEQKLTPFPHWTVSTRTPGKLYGILSEPVVDWYISTNVAQDLEPWHPPAVHTTLTSHQAVDYYYNIGALINLYSHTLSTGLGDAGQLTPDYVTYCLNTNIHPRLWSANAVSIYQWWLQRSNAQVTTTFSTNGNQSITTLSIAGATDPNTTVELQVPANGSALNLQVFTNSVLASGNAYRTTNQTIKLRVGTSVTTAQIKYVLGPNAQNDIYSTQAGTPLTVAGPGVLANDGTGLGTNLTAQVASAPANGSVTVNGNGGFTYTPASGFVGTDSFTYTATNDQTNSATATVTIVVSPAGSLFADNFSRATTPGSLSPWVPQSGAWMLSAGALVGGPNIQQIYSYAYLTNTWTDYSVQARVQFSSTNAWGGGIGGRLNTNTGAHYAAWLYPDGSPGGANTLKLIKFQTWTTFGYNGTNALQMQQVNVGAVGTNWHALKLAFLGNQIAVYYDNNLVMSVTDVEAQPYTNGAVSADMWTFLTPYNISIDDVVVSPLAAGDTYSTLQNVPLVVSAPGVLTNDSTVYTTNLTANLITSPTNGILNLSTNGSFTYTPNLNYVGPDAFVYQAKDGSTNLGNALVTITVNNVNHAPTLPAQPDRTIVGLASLLVTNTATDVDTPPQSLAYVFLAAPGGALIDTNGIITWSPTVAQVPSTNTFTTRVTDGGAPPLSTNNTFTVVVSAIHNGPSLVAQSDRTIDESTLLQVTNVVIDSDIPTNTLVYSLLSAPSGASIDPNSGVINWTPSEAQGPSTNTFTTRVTETGNPNPLSSTNSFKVVVNEINTPPLLPGQTNRTIAVGNPMTIVNTATDTNIPAVTLTYKLVTGPTNASIDTNGVITWTPLISQNNSSNLFTTVVTNFNPLAVNAQRLTATNSFSVFVSNNPVLSVAASGLLAEGCLPTNNAIDPGETVMVSIALRNTGLGPTANLVATLLETNGIVAPGAPQTYGVITPGGAAITQAFTLTATGICGGTITATLQLQDGPSNLGIITVPFGLGQTGLVFSQNFDSATRPALPAGWSTTTSNAQALWVTTNNISDSSPNSAYSTDAANVGVNELVSPQITLPLGTSFLSFRHSYSFESDTAHATNGYDGGVLEIKVGTNAFVDVTNNGGAWIANGYNRKIDSIYANPLSNRWAWSGTNGGFVTTTVSLPPASAGQTIQLRWRAGSDNGNPGGGWWVDSISITGAVCCANTAPVLPLQTNRTINELTTLIVTNTATDAEAPPEVLSYTLTVAPTNAPANLATNASISTNGVITWTPNEAQGPGVYLVTTTASDNANPPLSAINSFLVTVNEVNTPPVLTLPPAQTINELALWSANATAIDTDLPPNNLTFELVSGPAGLTVTTNGAIAWTPTEAQGPGSYSVSIRVYDNGSPNLSVTNSFNLTVAEVNSAPVLTLPPNQTINELALWTANATAVDTDSPPNSLTFELVSGPAGLTVTTNGAISWTPGEAQGPGNYTVTVRVYDGGQPSLSDTNSFNLTVNEVNSAPILTLPANQTINELAPWTGNATAVDTDSPPNTLTFELVTGPSGLTVGSNGLISWTPTEAQGPSTNTVTIRVYDDGTPRLSMTNSFTITVNEVNSAPILTLPSNPVIDEQVLWTANATAVDTDSPPNNLTFELVSGPDGLTVNSNGVITWTPGEAQGPGTNTVTIRVLDDGTPPLKTTNSFTVIVNEVNSAPVLPDQTNLTIVGLSPLAVTNTATDSDLPTNSLAYTLSAGPTNAVIDTNGIITWTPISSQVPSTNVFTTIVTDFNPYAATAQHLSATNNFTVVVVSPTNNGPSLPFLPDLTVDELVPLTVINTAADADLPPPTLSYSLTSAPIGMQINSNGIITWTPNEDQGPGAYMIQTLVWDTAHPNLAASNSFSIVVNEVNSPPTLPSQPDVTLYQPQTLSLINSATDLDRPANTVSYQLISAPPGAAISPDGLITWVPSPSQIPSTNIFTTVATDDNPWAVLNQHLSATNSFVVRVVDAGANPVILSINISFPVATVTWSAISGRTYRLQYTDSSHSTNWTDVLPDVTATGSSASANDTVTLSPRFYRVLLLP